MICQQHWFGEEPGRTILLQSGPRDRLVRIRSIQERSAESSLFLGRTGAKKRICAFLRRLQVLAEKCTCFVVNLLTRRLLTGSSHRMHIADAGIAQVATVVVQVADKSAYAYACAALQTQEASSFARDGRFWGNLNLDTPLEVS